MSSFAQLQAQARRRRFNHRVGGVAAIAAIALAVTAVPVTLHQFGGNKSAPAASDVPVRGSVASTPVQLSAIKKVVGTLPLDTHTAYAMMQTKDGKYGIVRTLDGRSWQAWTFPSNYMQLAAATEFGKKNGISIDTFLRPGYLPTMVSRLGIKFAGSLSRDGGESWSPIVEGQQVTLGDATPDVKALTDWLGAPLPSVPAGWPVEMFGPTAKDPEDFLATIDPATGVWHGVGTSPRTRATGTMLGIHADPTGVICAAYRTEPNKMAGTSVLAVSHDRGRTWIRHPIAVADQFVLSAPQSFDGKHAVVPLLAGPQPEVDQKYFQYGVLVTDDGGRSWTVRRTHGQTAPGNGANGPALSEDAQLLPDGSYLTTTHGKPGGLARSTDYGDTSEPIAGTEGAYFLQRSIIGGYLATADAGPAQNGLRKDKLMVSDDGLHWQDAPLPPVAK